MDNQDEQTNGELTPTPDDNLEVSRDDGLNNSVGNDPLPEDNDTPADDPTGVPQDPSTEMEAPNDTHPSTDSAVDETEEYDQGL